MAQNRRDENLKTRPGPDSPTRAEPGAPGLGRRTLKTYVMTSPGDVHDPLSSQLFCVVSVSLLHFMSAKNKHLYGCSVVDRCRHAVRSTEHLYNETQTTRSCGQADPITMYTHLHLMPGVHEVAQNQEDETCSSNHETTTRL